jgi:hypothetical protein
MGQTIQLTLRTVGILLAGILHAKQAHHRCD